MRKRLLFWISRLILCGSAGMLLLAMGCSPSPAKVTAASAKGAPLAETSATKIPLKWDSFPLSDRMLLATVPCQLLPKSLITIHSPLAGELRVYLTTPQTNVTANLVWAEFEPKIFAAEEQAIEESRQKLEEREKLQWELEVPRQKLQLSRQLEEAQRHLAMLHLLATNKELAELTLSTGIPGENPLKPESIGKAQTEMGLITQTLAYLNATNLAVLGVDLPGQKSEWQRRKLEFDRRRAEATLKMPFSGQLTVSLPLTEGVDAYPVTVGQELAVARDLSMIRVRVPLANAAWSDLPPDKLQAVVRLNNGSPLIATFVYQKLERPQQREESVYYFQFPASQSVAAGRLIGTDVGCEIWFNLPQTVRVVPKISLLLQQPQAFQGRTWYQGLNLIAPESRLLAEGQTELGIVPGEDKPNVKK